MAETWVERQRREAREVHAAVDALLASPATGAAFRTQLEETAKKPSFNQTSYRWGPWLWRRLRDDRDLRIQLRPFLLGHLDGSAFDEKGRWSWAFERDPKGLDAWLTEVDAARDTEVYRRLLQWKLQVHWATYAKRYRELLLGQLAAARTPTERQEVLERFDFHAELDEPTALRLYEAVGPLARRFILQRLGWAPKDLWESLHRRALDARDDELAWELYRAQASSERWARDVKQLTVTVPGGEELVAALEQRHPRAPKDAGPVFLELAKARGGAVLPYLQRHARAVFPRWGWFGRGEGKSLEALVALADENGWTALWAKLLQGSATPELWNKTVEQLLRGDPRTMTSRQKLMLLAGAGGEWNFGGFGLAQVQPLSDDVACLMDERAPELLRGPFRMHLPLSAQHAYPKLLARVLKADDEGLCDFFASRAAMDAWANADAVKALTAHYEALSITDGTFVRRATNALSMMPAYAIWNYGHLLEKNALARLLFERSTPLYLQEGTLLRELLESPQIHVQALAFRVLGTDDPRAGKLAAGLVDVLAPTLLRALHRRTRLMALGAVKQAVLADETAARHLVSKLKDALALPDKKYPKEGLIGVLAAALHRWPSLRSAREAPAIYREATP